MNRSPRRSASRRKLAVIALLIAAVVYVFLLNTSFLARPFNEPPFLIAHRGLAQDFDREGLTGKTCTAARMLPSEHEFLENTLPSTRAAFDFGADMVEADVHRTADDRLVVFHDWTVECRTEGKGAVREHTLEALQKLDVGYGYTADGGETYPFRGRGVGLMPSLEDLLMSFPDRAFLLDLKSNDAQTGVLAADLVKRLSRLRTGEVALTGGSRAVAAVLERLPELRTVTRPRLKACLKNYLALGWTSRIPEACRDSILTVPANVAPWLWGWPHRFFRRMDQVNTQVVLLGDYHGEGFSTGFNDPSRVESTPATGGGIWTDRIDLIGPALRSAQTSKSPSL